MGKKPELAPYSDMAREEEREAETHAWAETTVGDIMDETSRERGGEMVPLGARIAARFAGLGFMRDVPELRGDEGAEDDDLEPEYDFSGAVRGKYYQRNQQGTNVVLLDPDVAQTFKDSASIKQALRLLLDLAKQEVRPLSIIVQPPLE